MTLDSWLEKRNPAFSKYGKLLLSFFLRKQNFSTRAKIGSIYLRKNLLNIPFSEEKNANNVVTTQFDMESLN